MSTKFETGRIYLSDVFAAVAILVVVAKVPIFRLRGRECEWKGSPFPIPHPLKRRKLAGKPLGYENNYPMPGHCGTAQSENGLHRRNFPQGLAYPIPHAMGRMF